MEVLFLIVFLLTFFAGIILYTFLHFDSTPAIITSVVIGLAIVFCAGAVVHNVFLWRKVRHTLFNTSFFSLATQTAKCHTLKVNGSLKGSSFHMNRKLDTHSIRGGKGNSPLLFTSRLRLGHEMGKMGKSDL